MARLLNWPRGLRVVAWQPLTGPRTVGAASTESITGYIQTVQSPFGLRRIQITLEDMKGRLFRRYRGMVEALHGGANAVRIAACDPDGISWEDAGVIISADQRRNGIPFSNGMPCSNGMNLQASRPSVEVVEDAAKGSSIISLSNAFWGHDLDVGDQIGFFPFHLAAYKITEVVSAGRYRLSPPLRAAITAGSTYATLNPVIAMRLEGESAASTNRGNINAQANTMTLIEVDDNAVRSYFAN